MSRRSYDSTTYGHERRISKHRVTDDDLFKYVDYCPFSKSVESDF